MILKKKEKKQNTDEQYIKATIRLYHYIYSKKLTKKLARYYKMLYFCNTLKQRSNKRKHKWFLSSVGRAMD